MTATDHLDDEHLTALQDGDGSSDERAHLEGCARCRARADALVGAATLVGTPPSPPSNAARDTAVAAALREADRPVVPLRRARRRRVSEWLAPVAAVLVLLALIAVVVPQLGDGGDGDDDASREAATAESAERAQRGGGSSENNDLRSAAPPATDLGAVDDEADLARRVDDALASEAAGDAAGAPLVQEDPCAASFRSLAPPLGPLRLRAAVVWRGEAAEVASDGEQAVVLAAGSCAPLATVAIP
jgi:hypothetical protein